MKKKIVYLTQWIAKDTNKKYPHGWGFEPPIVEFSQDRDPAEIIKLCSELSNDEFECIGAIPREMIDGEFEILGIIPGPEKGSEEWAMRDIDLIFDNADFSKEQKLKEIESIVSKYFNQPTIKPASLPVTGESEAIGERKFTLKEALDIWESASKSAYNCVYPEGPCSFNSEQHTQYKQAYFLSIGIDKI